MKCNYGKVSLDVGANPDRKNEYTPMSEKDKDFLKRRFEKMQANSLKSKEKMLAMG